MKIGARVVWALAIGIVISGCSGLSARDDVLSALEGASAEAALTAHRYTCDTIRMAAWRAMYGHSEEQAEAWGTLCRASSPVPPGD